MQAHVHLHHVIFFSSFFLLFIFFCVSNYIIFCTTLDIVSCSETTNETLLAPNKPCGHERPVNLKYEKVVPTLNECFKKWGLSWSYRDKAIQIFEQYLVLHYILHETFIY